jgi:hypothetical protein
MTTYAAPTAAAFVSEREVAHLWVDGVTKDDAAWEDCDPCAVLQVAKAAKPSLTVSHTEAERLRRAAGYGAFGGTAVEKVGPAAATRYGVAITVKSGITDAALILALKPGTGGAIIGKLASLPTGHTLRRFAPGFLGFHQVSVFCLALGVYWWIDPLGPKDGVYHGEHVTAAEISTFFTGSVGLAAMAPVPVPAPTTAPVVAPTTTTTEVEAMVITSETALLVSIPVGTPFYDLAGKQAFASTVAVSGRLSPWATALGGVEYRAIRATGTNGAKEIYLVRSSACSSKLDAVGAYAAAGFASAKTKATAASAAAIGGISQ